MIPSFAGGHMIRAFVLFFLVAFGISQAHAGYVVKQVRKGDQVFAVGAAKKNIEPYQAVLVGSMPRFLPEGAPPSEEMIETVVYSESQFTQLLDQPGFAVLNSTFTRAEWVGSEVRTITQQGPPENRINLTIVGDGYTVAEKEKFFADAKRMTNDMFVTATFKSYLPLFNVYAVFVPSKDSGISDTRRRDTALGLYRSPANSKRAIMPGNIPAIDKAIALAPVAADYPILLANDDFYGGLGGQYAITTRSLTTGTIVLRHELGHNFGYVGEEYDGGYVYRGANSSPSAKGSWAQWALNNNVKTFEAKALFGDYVWQDLRTPYIVNFKMPEDKGWSFGLQISSVGWSTPEDVTVKVDNQTLTLKGKFHSDRSFLYPVAEIPLAPGNHALSIKESISDGDNVLSFARGYAYPPSYDFTPNLIGAFPTFDINGSTNYRPTHESCLMRNMETDKFCSVDQENMWFRFFSKVELIDSLKVERGVNGSVAEVKTPQLQGLEIQWFKTESSNRTEISEAKNQTTLNIPSEFKGTISVKVRFITPEIRKSSDRLTAEKSVNL